MTFRAFIAADIEPNDALVGLLTELRRSGGDLKVVRPELLHVTLRFLGDTEESSAGRIMEIVQEAVRGTAPFKVRLVGMGAFPSMSNIRVVWVGMEDGGVMSDIARRLDGPLEGIGFARDQKGFKAHLTIARARGSRGMAAVQTLLRERAATDFGTYEVGTVKLKKSVLGPQGPTYSDVGEAPLSR